MRNRNPFEILLYAILVYIMVMCLNLALVDSTGMDIPLLHIALYNLIILALVMAAILYPVSVAIEAVSAVFAAIYLVIAQPAWVQSFWQKGILFCQWSYGYTIGNNAFDNQYALVFGIAYSVLVTLTIALMVMARKGSLIVLLLGTVALTFFWYIYVEKARTYLLFYLFAGLMAYAYNKYRQKLKEWQQNDKIASKDIAVNWMLSTAFIITAAILVTLFLPLNIKPVHWPWLNERVVGLFPALAEWRNDVSDSYDYGFGSRYNSSAAGYGASQLGGPVTLSSEVMMTVETQSKDTIYLRGAVKDIYEKNSWIKAPKMFSGKKSGEKLDMPFSVDSNDTYNVHMAIAPVKLSTSSIFAPNQLYSVSLANHDYFVDQDNEAYFSKRATKEDTYITDSYMPYMDVKALRSINVRSLPGASGYLRLPSNITRRTKDLAADITSPYKNDYDKIKAVEYYLRTHYGYNLKAARIPAGREFTDQFLFETREGYCTYFATSMAVLLRSAGIPCRYVEGFISPYEGSDMRTIKGTNAHAWVEVDFGDYGWLNFEPTPAYSIVTMREAPDRVEVGAAGSQSSETADESIIVSGHRGRDGSLSGDEEAYEGSGTPVSAKGKEKWKSIAMSVLLFLFTARLIQLFAIRLYRELSRRKADGRAYVGAYMKRFSTVLQKMGMTIEPHNTIREVFHDASFYFGDRCNLDTQLTAVLEKAAYGNAALTAEEKGMLESQLKEVRQLAPGLIGRTRYYLQWFIKGD